MLTNLDPFAQRDQIVLLALHGQSPRMLALRFGVTEWTIKRWVQLARRREQLPYWRKIGALPSQRFGEATLGASENSKFAENGIVELNG